MKQLRPRQMAIVMALLAILAMSAGCTRVGIVEHAGIERSTDIHFEYGDLERPMQVTLNLGAAELRADARGEALLEGVIEYNASDLEPEVTSGSSWVEIEQQVERVGEFRDAGERHDDQRWQGLQQRVGGSSVDVETGTCKV